MAADDLHKCPRCGFATDEAHEFQTHKCPDTNTKPDTDPVPDPEPESERAKQATFPQPDPDPAPDPSPEKAGRKRPVVRVGLAALTIGLAALGLATYAQANNGGGE